MSKISSMPHLRQEVGAGDHFTFCSSMPRMTDTNWSYDIEIATSDQWSGEYDDDSEFASLALWKDSGMPATQAYLDHELARCQQEMLNMVPDLPESAYELSLRDLVELPRIVKASQESQEMERRLFHGKLNDQKKLKKGGRRVSRSLSMEGGFLLKMFFPVSLGRKKRKVSPKPTSTTDGGKAGIQIGLNAEWLAKNELHELSKTSSREMNGCYPFFQKSKSR